jgi:hypothetical protein
MRIVLLSGSFLGASKEITLYVAFSRYLQIANIAAKEAGECMDLDLATCELHCRVIRGILMKEHHGTALTRRNWLLL